MPVMKPHQNASDEPPREYDDYEPQHPDLIPSDEREAWGRLGIAIAEGVSVCSKDVFLKGWWALHWLNPGLHPDDCEDWGDPDWLALACEAFRRTEASELEESELYAAEAVHNRVWIERNKAAE